MILNGIFGNNDLQFSDGVHGNIGFANGHFVTLDSTQAFKFFPEEAASGIPVVRRFLSTLPSSILSGMSASESSEFIHALNETLSRFEKIPVTDLERVVAPYTEGAKSFRSFKNLPDFDFTGELKRRIGSARMETLKYLEDRKLDPGALAALRTPLEIPTPKISTPSLRLRADAIPSAREHAPVELLWAHYFQDFWKARSNAEQKWAGELPGSNGNGLKAVQKLAAKDQSKIDEVSTHMQPRFAFAEQDRAAPMSKSLAEILRIENPVDRVNALKSLHGNSLTPAEIQLAIDHASASTNSFEIAQMIRIAEDSKSPAWTPTLNRWLTEWKGVQRGWQTYQLEPARRARIEIGAAQGDLDCEPVFAKFKSARP